MFYQHVRLQVHPWVIWWIALGVVCGVVALLNILMHNLSRGQEDAVIVVGAVHWILGGLVCWAMGSVKVEAPPLELHEEHQMDSEREWHSASEFILPGGRKSLLPPRY